MNYKEYNPRFLAEKICHGLGFYNKKYIEYLITVINVITLTDGKLVDIIDVFENYVKNGMDFLEALNRALIEVA